MRVLLLRLMLRNLHPLPVVSRQLVPGSSSCFVLVDRALKASNIHEGLVSNFKS